MKLRSAWKNFKALCIGIFIAFVLAEVILRLYNPFEFRVRGNQIVLPANQEYTVDNTDHPQLDPEIVHKKNSIGFRGPEKPDDWEAAKTVIAVGGSTTECFYLTDGKDWPAQLLSKLKPTHPNLWINNAGFDGHSTFGHRVLMEDYIQDMAPDMVLLLMGVNEIGIDQVRKFDSTLYGYDSGFKGWIINNSEVISTVVNIKRAIDAKNAGVAHANTEWESLGQLELADSVIAEKVAEFEPNRGAYAKRLNGLIDLCAEKQIQAVLLTQPILWGDTTDPVTGIHLGHVNLGEGENGTLKWRMMEAYNDVTRQVAAQRGVKIVDLARQMEKSTALFYDYCHYTNAGAERVAEIIATDLGPVLEAP